MFNFDNVIKFVPEIVLIITIFIQFILSFFSKRRIANFVSLLGMFISAISLINSFIYPTELYITFFKVLILISSMIVLNLTSCKSVIKRLFTFNILYLSSVFFLMMIVNSNDYLSLFFNIELFSLCLYFLISIDRKKITVAETIKYMIMSVLSSAFLLLGVSFIYGLTGSLEFYNIREYFAYNQNYTFSSSIVPYIFISIGLFFKLGVFPFGNWVIDIYKNINTKLVTYISVIPKLAIFTVLIKILPSIISFEFSLFIIFLACITGGFGVLYGLKSKNLKEIMASSSYINVSYMLMVLALYTKISLSALMFYWICYVFMNIGAFAGILVLEHSGFTNNCVDIRGYFYKNPIFSLCFIVCIVGLMGFPITSGFVGKLYLVSGILNSGIISIPLLLFMFFLMVSSVVIYMNIIKRGFEDKYFKDAYFIKKSANTYILYVCTLVTIFIGLFPAWGMKFCELVSYYI